MAIAAIVVVLAAPLIDLVGGPSDSRDQAAAYLRIGALGLPFTIGSFAASGALRGLQDTSTPFLGLCGCAC